MSRLESFTGGEHLAVDPDAIERELAAVWREAGRSTESARPVTRACLWNVLFCLDFREAGGCPGWLEALVAQLPEHLAARAIVLRVEAEGEPELKSWISANCRLAADGGKLVCSEAVTLAARGPGAGHLPALCRAVLVPGVPTAVVFGGVPDLDEPLARELVRSSDRVVTWAARCGREAPFDRARRAGEQRLHVDLGWTAQADLRAAVAALFDGSEDELEGLEAVTASSEAGALLLGWVASRLGASAADDGALEGDGVRVKTKITREPLLFALDRRGDRPAVRFRGPGGERSATREAGGDVRIEGPDGCWRFFGRSQSEAELLAQALLHRARDAELAEALAQLHRLRGGAPA